VNEPRTETVAGQEGSSPEIAEAHKRDFWIEENQKHSVPHFRLRKCARLVNVVARGRECDLLDVGCGPGTLMGSLDKKINYYGIDLAIHQPAANLREADILKMPIAFGDMSFDIIVAQGLFEYLADLQSQKFSEIVRILRGNGAFIVTYTNFSHRDARIFEAFSNVRKMADFQQDLERYFRIEKRFPVSHNWHGGQPTRKVAMAANEHVNVNIPFFSPKLAVEYFFVCRPR
jgi:SAM-dependent methyltransferase